jgi:transposase
MNCAGIDVGSKELVLVIRRKGKSRKAKKFTNTPKGFAAIIKCLNMCAGSFNVCVEATGIYHFDLAVALDEAHGIEIMVVNPKAAKNFAGALMCRTKTDPVDAETLAQFAERMEFTPWKRPDEKILNLRALSRRIAAVTKLKAQTKNQLHALESTLYTPEPIIEHAHKLIKHLEEEIASLKEYALTLIRADVQLLNTLELLLSVKGIAETSAIQLMGELLVLPKDMTNRQWVAFAGLDPRHFKSGSSINKKPRISKAGNRYLRMTLYMPALCAANKDRNVQAYYLHLIEDQGLKKMQAICAVMRKLLHAVHGMLKSQKPFDSKMFYRLAS